MVLELEIGESESPDWLPAIFQELIDLTNQILDRARDVNDAVCPVCHTKNDTTARNPPGDADFMS